MWALAPHILSEKCAHRLLSALRLTVVESIRYVASRTCRRRPLRACPSIVFRSSSTRAAGRDRLASASVERFTGPHPRLESTAAWLSSSSTRPRRLRASDNCPYSSATS